MWWDGWCTEAMMATPLSDARCPRRAIISIAEAASNPVVGSSLRRALHMQGGANRSKKTELVLEIV